MRGYQKSVLIIVAFIMALLAVTAVTSRHQKKPVQQNQSDDNQLPLIEYPGTNITKGRTNAGQRGIKEDASALVITESDSLIERLPALPSSQSDVVVIGGLVDANAYLTDEARDVQTRYKLSINEILKNQTSASFSPGSVVSLIRKGGRVRFPSGRIQTYRVSGEGVLHVGKRHLLFLRKLDQSPDYLLLTAYQLENGQVLSVDDLASHREYEKLAEIEFLKKVRQSIIH